MRRSNAVDPQNFERRHQADPLKTARIDIISIECHRQCLKTWLRESRRAWQATEVPRRPQTSSQSRSSNVNKIRLQLERARDDTQSPPKSPNRGTRVCWGPGPPLHPRCQFPLSQSPEDNCQWAWLGTSSSLLLFILCLVPSGLCTPSPYRLNTGHCIRLC